MHQRNGGASALPSSVVLLFKIMCHAASALPKEKGRCITVKLAHWQDRADIIIQFSILHYTNCKKEVAQDDLMKEYLPHPLSGFVQNKLCTLDLQ
jgi:hypothetical protein